MNEKFLTVKELAARWKKSRRQIYAMKNKGELPYTLLGGSIRFPIDKIEHYEASHTFEGYLAENSPQAATRRT
ncbi:helix-turn-helix domain-containing protein [candidate division KSB3 bacterium]|uniref:Helix-turn-helix domain-containing protein n=1 Tax=candidate division KSB3 bacterium TaxID=2044937 RepID=A0A9D5Q833_9BACT|nr:helix-turn-helix domain-containing protein [candidate division KSB3 bacterium]